MFVKHIREREKEKERKREGERHCANIIRCCTNMCLQLVYGNLRVKI